MSISGTQGEPWWHEWPLALAEEPARHSSRLTFYHAAMRASFGSAGQANVSAARCDGGPTRCADGIEGFIMALLVLTPESLAAIKASLANRLQRSVNILLGSVLASIGLTIPLVIAVSLCTGRVLVLGLDPTGTAMLLLTSGNEHPHIFAAENQRFAGVCASASVWGLSHADV